MSEKILKLLSEHLTKEKWTRLTVPNYTINDFLELDNLLEQIFTADIEEQAMELCAEQLTTSKNSIVALYLSGIINLNRQFIDDSNLLLLINLFNEKQRWNIIEHLCKRILDFGENRHALRNLAECYVHENKPEQQYKIWERLIRVDYEEADIVYKLAKYEEAQGHMEEAASYYKRALHRYINKKSFDQIHEIMLKLMELVPSETEFFHHAEGRVSKIIGKQEAVELLKLQYPYFFRKKDWTTSISILKQILTCDSKDIKARKEIVDCYKAKYENHSHLEEYIRLSNLNQNWRNVHDAIQDFEKHIAFDKGNFVYHRSWGIGRITSTKDDEIIVDFAQKKNHKMSLKMAVSSFQVLDKNHIWVYRITKKKEVLNKKVKTDSLWALKTIIRSFDNAADLKKIKAELVPGILSINEWPSWSLKARDILKTGEAFGNLPDNPDIYTVRDQPMSLEERTYNRFKAEKDFFDRIKTLQEFMEFIGDNGESLENDLFLDMFDYFVTYVRNPGSYNEHTISAMLIILRIVNQFPFLNPGVNLNFKEYFTNLEDYEEMFQKINNTDIRKLFLTHIHKHKIPDWNKIYITLLPYYLHKDVVRELITANHQDTVIQKFLELYNNYRDMREPYIWFVKNCIHDDWFAKTGVEREKILISMIHLLDITARDIDNKRDVILNRKLHKQVFNFLVKDNTLFDYIRMSNEDIVGRIYSLLEDVKDMDAKVMKMIQKTISERFPNFAFFSNQADVLETTTRSGFLSIMKSYEGRQKALKRLHDVEVPKNSKEIAAAREYGDLKENAEYKAAKERQDILNTTARKWEEELQSVQIIQPDSIHYDKVGFGTMIVLLNLITNTEETVTIMGPWESNPEKKILSHLSPFASKLLNNTVGQVIEFTINKRDYRYEIKNILPVNFDEIEPMSVSI